MGSASGPPISRSTQTSLCRPLGGYERMHLDNSASFLFFERCKRSNFNYTTRFRCVQDCATALRSSVIDRLPRLKKKDGQVGVRSVHHVAGNFRRLRCRSGSARDYLRWGVWSLPFLIYDPARRHSRSDVLWKAGPRESPDHAQRISRRRWEGWGLTSVHPHSEHVDFPTCDFPFSTSVGLRFSRSSRSGEATPRGMELTSRVVFLLCRCRATLER